MAIEPPINPYIGYADQTRVLHTAFADVVKANEATVYTLKKGLASEYATLLKRLQEIVGQAHRKYAVAGKLNYQELVRYDRIKALSREINTAISENYSPIRRHVIQDQRLVVENTYTTAIQGINAAAETNVNPNISGARILEILNKPWSGVTTAERLYLRQQYLGIQINGQIGRDVMGDGVGYRESMANLKKLIVKEYAGMGRTIDDTAHTLQGDAEQAAFDRMRDEAEITKTWVSAGDNRVRDAHILLDGQTVGAQEMFEIPSGDWVGWQADAPGLFGEPALDSNCRCWLVAGIR